MNDKRRDNEDRGPRAAEDAGDVGGRAEDAAGGSGGAPDPEADAPMHYDLGGLGREELESELELARAEIERLQDQSLRRQAELINFRRRAQREMAEAASTGQGRLLELLLPVIDDFERAVDVEVEDAGTYREGVQLILRRLQKVLEQIGVERIEPRGEPFDPRVHEAIARHETDDVPAGQVIEVYQPGYKLAERLLRPATVVVAYGGDSAGDDDVAQQGRAGGGDDAANDG